MDGLVITGTDALVRRVRLSPSRDVIRIGRSPRCDIILAHPSISRYHARLERDGDHYLLVDEGGCSRVTVDDLPVEAPTPVAPGLVIVMGPYEMTIQRPVKSPAGNPPYRVDYPDDFGGAIAVERTADKMIERRWSHRARTWRQIVDFVAGQCRDRRWFLSRAETRGLKDQAGDDYRAGDDMAEAMERFARMGRDRALETLRSWEPPQGTDLVSTIRLAVAELESQRDPKDGYGQLGVSYVIATLRRTLEFEEGR